MPAEIISNCQSLILISNPAPLQLLPYCHDPNFKALEATWSYQDSSQGKAYELKPKVWGRVGPDPQAELQVDPARGPQAQGLGRPLSTFLLHHLNRGTVIRLARYIMDIIWAKV